jgi:alkylation response protein AidB-like acyl-CoA dehydrogenase
VSAVAVDRADELVGRARELGPAFAARSERHDREASFPYDDFADLRDAGFLGLCIPASHGGLGADFATYARVSEELGRHAPATALSFNMHCVTMMLTGQIAGDLTWTSAEAAMLEDRRRTIYEGVLGEGHVHAQPFSEGILTGATVGYATTATPVDGGFLVNGRKIFASLSGAADYYGTLCTEDKPEAGMRDTLYLAIAADAAGVSLTGDWDPLGMRGTVSRTLVLKDVLVPDSAQLMPRGVYFQAAMRWPHMFSTLSPTYMGIAQAAYDFTVQYLRGEVPGAPPVKRRMYPTKQIAVAQMRVMLEQTRALFLRALADAKVDPSKDERLRVYAAQYTIMENANELCRLAIRTCGGQSMLRSLPLERMYRDSRCGSLMLPWTAELCLDRIGREALYEPGESDD